MEEINWVDGETILNKKTMDKFQSNIKTAITNINDNIGTINNLLDEINGEEV